MAAIPKLLFLLLWRVSQSSRTSFWRAWRVCCGREETSTISTSSLCLPRSTSTPPRMLRCHPQSSAGGSSGSFWLIRPSFPRCPFRPASQQDVSEETQADNERDGCRPFCLQLPLTGHYLKCWSQNGLQPSLSSSAWVSPGTSSGLARGKGRRGKLGLMCGPTFKMNCPESVLISRNEKQWECNSWFVALKKMTFF